MILLTWPPAGCPTGQGQPGRGPPRPPRWGCGGAADPAVPGHAERGDRKRPEAPHSPRVQAVPSRGGRPEIRGQEGCELGMRFRGPGRVSPPATARLRTLVSSTVPGVRDRKRMHVFMRG